MSLLSRSIVTACYDDFSNGVDAHDIAHSTLHTRYYCAQRIAHTTLLHIARHYYAQRIAQDIIIHGTLHTRCNNVLCAICCVLYCFMLYTLCVHANSYEINESQIANQKNDC